jgi:hypothetical protein
MSLVSSVASPVVAVVTAIVDLERGQCSAVQVGQWMGADFVALVSTLRFLDPALAKVLTTTCFGEIVDVILSGGLVKWVMIAGQRETAFDAYCSRLYGSNRVGVRYGYP